MVGAIDNIIAKCNQHLDEAYEYLHYQRQDRLARSVDAVIDHLAGIKARHTESVQQIVNDYNIELLGKDDDLSKRLQELEQERSARRAASRIAEQRQQTIDQQQKTVLDQHEMIKSCEQTILDQHKMIKSHEQSIKSLQDALAKERKNAEDQYRQGYKKGFAEGDQAGGRDVSEVVAQRSLGQGLQAFDAKNYKDARRDLLSAKTAIDKMTPDRRGRFETSKLHYALAVSSAYVEDIEQAKSALTAFLRHTSAFANDEELLQIAHVQHLLAQICIGLDNLPEAIAACDSAFKTRDRKLAPTHNCLHQTIALRALMYEYAKKSRDAATLRKSIPDQTRDALQQLYGSLRPLEKTIARGSELIAQPSPATQLLPVWLMANAKAVPVQPLKPGQPLKPVSTPSGKQQGGKTTQLPPTPPRTPAVDRKSRDALLTELNLTTNPGQELSWRMKQAVVTGNQKDVASRIDNGDHVGPPALHLAALFNELEIANLLVERGGANVNGQCTCNSSKSGKSVYGVTPMHLAIGARNVKMIQYLAKNGGNFGRQAAGAGQRYSAPPLWLLNERWLSKPGNAEPQKVVTVLATMKDCGWDTYARLNDDGRTMKDLAKNLASRPALQGAVLQFLS
ncbi:hypothetical protein AC579_5827 [Pseudocercospora musae]|uniref:Uncharacterized protein n=1 Tax=Pseudocercospora musae TaxID=113226 RepID=A0A139ILV5_9PEZI|nr:hypothetical protein AC579_5827 [Pseudocercospora musae]